MPIERRNDLVCVCTHARKAAIDFEQSGDEESSALGYNLHRLVDRVMEYAGVPQKSSNASTNGRRYAVPFSGLFAF
jgi:hypothetical protein